MLPKPQKLLKLNIVEGVYSRHLLPLLAKCLEMPVAIPHYTHKNKSIQYQRNQKEYEQLCLLLK